MTARKDFRIVRDKFANDSGLPFGRLLSREYVLSALEGHCFRSRVFCPLVVLWGWLSQCLSQDKSLNEVVSRILVNRVATGLPACSANSASYSNARMRFPEPAMKRMASEIGRKVHQSRTPWRWHGREVFLADGTHFSMPDTPENQLAFPQVKTVARGVGFPIMRAVALISLSTGAVVDLAFGRYAGKGTGEMGLLGQVAGSLSPGNVLVADRYYPSYKTVAMLKDRGVDLVSISHKGRHVDFRRGESLGPNDQIAEWHRGQYHTSRGENAHDHYAMPETIRMREFVIEIEARNGCKKKIVIVTTLTDPTIPQKQIADLYRERWSCELDFRAIKHSLHMDVLRCKSPEMVRKELWCHLLAYNLLWGTMTETAKRHAITPRQLSVKGAMQAVESFTPAMMAVGSDTLYDAMLTTVSAHRVGNRPGRVEPRMKKRRPTWQVYMMKPRHKLRRRLESSAP